MFSLRSIQLLTVTVLGLWWALGRAQMFPLPCADTCKLITTDSLIQCRCDDDAEVSPSCYLSFGKRRVTLSVLLGQDGYLRRHVCLERRR